MQIGHIIASLRAEKKISQRKLASELNISSGVVGMWETGKRLPSLECFIALIDFFGVSADRLLEKDRALRPEEYQKNFEFSTNTKKLLIAFNELTEDNQDIIIGKTKELLKEQRMEIEKKKRSAQ